jgi:hypothetical protein
MSETREDLKLEYIEKLKILKELKEKIKEKEKEIKLENIYKESSVVTDEINKMERSEPRTINHYYR